MILKHSTSIFLSKFNLVYKVILYSLIITLLVTAICVAITSPVCSNILKEIKGTGLFSNFKHGVGQLCRGDEGFIETFGLTYESLHQVKDIFTSSTSDVIELFVIVGVGFLVGIYLLAMSFLPFSDIISNFMSSNSKYGFASNFVANLAKSALFALVYTFTAVIVTCAIFAFGVWIIVETFAKLGLLSLTISLIVVMLLVSLRSTLLAGWLPAVVGEKCGVFRGFRRGFLAVCQHFQSVFWTFFIINLLLFALSFGLCLFTFGVGLIFVVPVYFLIYRVVELVLYYNAKGYHYYVDKETIISTSVYSDVIGGANQ